MIALRPLWLHRAAEAIGYAHWSCKRAVGLLMRSVASWLCRAVRQREKQAFDCKAFVKMIDQAAKGGRGGSRGVGSCGEMDDSHNRAPGSVSHIFNFSPLVKIARQRIEANKKET